MHICRLCGDGALDGHGGAFVCAMLDQWIFCRSTGVTSAGVCPCGEEGEEERGRVQGVTVWGRNRRLVEMLGESEVEKEDADG